MKHSFLTFLCLPLIATTGVSQIISASFSLLSGPTNGVFPASKGLFLPNIYPGGRNNHNIIVRSGIVYIFLGDTSGSPGNDVWAFNVTSKYWGWMNGYSNTYASSYGVRDIELPSNTPGRRYDCGGDYHSTRKEFVLFGGSTPSNNYFSDVWTFSLSSNMWTWRAGPNYTVPPTFNTRGVMNNTSTPGGRAGMACVVYPPTGELLCFAGYSALTFYMADMWSFDFGYNQWTWISGPSTIGGIVGIGGAKGEFSTAYFPTSRAFIKPVLDTHTNNIYIFGGASGQDRNNLWVFRRETVEWARIFDEMPTNYGTKGISSSTNYPGARRYYAACYHEASRLLLLHGGIGFDSSDTVGNLSDMWTLDLESYEWIWLAGSSQVDTESDYSIENAILGGVAGHALSVDQQRGTIFIFGGAGSGGYTNELWKVQIDDQPVQISLIRAEYSTTSSKKKASQKTGGTSINSVISEVSPILLYVIIGAVGILLLTAFAISAWFYRLRKRASRKKSEVAMSAQSTNTQVSFATIISESSYVTTQSTGMTVAPTSIGIYLPGGLQVSAETAYRKESMLARGGGGTVWLSRAFEPGLQDFGEMVVVKIPNATVMNERALGIFHQEIALNNAFNSHPNIAKLLGFSDNPYSIILKYYPRGSLLKWQQSKERTLRQAQIFFTDIARGLMVLHNGGVAHCDIKPDNVLIDDGPRLKAVLTDFGIARIVSNRLLNVAAYSVQDLNGASIAYASPETLKEFRKNKSNLPPNVIIKRDLYALGMIIHSILTARKYNGWRNTTSN